MANGDAANVTAARSTSMETVMRRQRKAESAEERKERQAREARNKLEERAEADAAIDEMIRRNIELYGP